MSSFYSRPILNSPYTEPQRHWELDPQGQPTQQTLERRRPAQYITPIPKPRKRKGKATDAMVFDEGKGLPTQEQEYDPTPLINQVRDRVAVWRRLPQPTQWGVTPETARLLQHWRTRMEQRASVLLSA
jgi:type III restriction enzyme